MNWLPGAAARCWCGHRVALDGLATGAINPGMQSVCSSDDPVCRLAPNVAIEADAVRQLAERTTRPTREFREPSIRCVGVSRQPRQR